MQKRTRLQTFHCPVSIWLKHTDNYINEINFMLHFDTEITMAGL